MSLIGLLTLCAIVTMAAAGSYDAPRHYDLEKAPELFAAFMRKYNRTYKNQEDWAIHYVAFVQNLRDINRQNIQYPDALFVINSFADYTDEEKRQIFGYNPNLLY